MTKKQNKFIINMIKITYRYADNPNEYIICGYNLEISPHKINFILGPSGSGKTIVTNFLLGNLNEEKFIIEMDLTIILKDRIFKFKNYNNYIIFVKKLRNLNYFGYISQTPDKSLFNDQNSNINGRHLLKPFSLLEFYYYFCCSKEKSFTSEIVINKLNQLLNNLNININKDLDEILPQDLSGGQKQRFALGCVLERKPLFIVGDEITSSLDIQNADLVYQLLIQYIKSYNNVFCICITHDNLIAKNTEDEKNIFFIDNRELKLIHRDEI